MPTATIIGLGKSGNAAARLLKTQGYSVTISDQGTSELLQTQAQLLERDSIMVKLGDSFDPRLSPTDLLVVSPGVPWDHPMLTQARARGIVTIGEMELAWRSLRERPWVAITGTNGKTTTTALSAAMFQAAGLCAPAFGNIGLAACEVAALEQAPDWAIAELSSYQIESAPTLSPHIAIFTTFTPDHLARHKTLNYYYELKSQLLARSRLQIVNGDDPYLRQIAGDFPLRQETCWTSVQGRAYLPGNPDLGTYIEDGWVISRGEAIVATSTLKMPGAHNLQNLLMAVAAAKLAGIHNDAIATAVAQFPGVEHRLEYILSWKGIDFINDSKATNYDAAEVGLKAVKAPAILIAGGAAKEGNDEAWLAAIKTCAAAVLLIGEAAPAFASRLDSIGYQAYEIVETMERAVARSGDLATLHSCAVVLLSPACASFDQYSSFEHRGDEFRSLCIEKFGS